MLIPRPETELLVEAALAHLPPTATPRVLDLGTGSGCVAVTLKLERPCIDLTAVDISPVALAIARANAAELGANLHFIQSDWFVALAGQRFDLIVSNPPYIAAADPHLTQGDLRFEPYGALASGDDGLDAPRRLIATAPAHLVPQGWLWLEHGYNQGEAVAGLLHEHGFSAIETRQDLAGHDRLSGGRMA